MANPSFTQLQRLDSGYKINGVTPTAVVERTGLAIIGRDRAGNPKVDYRVEKQVNRLIPKIVGTADILIEVGAQSDFNSEVVWSGVYDFRPGVDQYVDFDPPVSGNLIAVRFSSVTEEPWTLQGYDLELSLLGNLGGPLGQ